MSCGQKDSQWNSIIQLHLRRSLRLSKKKHGQHFFGTQRVDFGRHYTLYIIPHGQIINSDLHIQTLQTLQKHFRRVQPHKNATEILLKCDNAQSHTSFKCRKQSQNLDGQPRSCSFRFEPLWSPQRCHPWKVWQRERGYLKSEEVAASTKSNLVQKGDRYPCSSLAQGS